MKDKKFASALSVSEDSDQAISEVVSLLKDKLGESSCDLLMVFISEGYPGTEYKDMLMSLEEKTQARMVISCNANGVIAGGREIEMKPALSVFAMHLPDVQIRPLVWSVEALQQMKEGEDMIKDLDLYPTEKPHFIILADPQTCDVNHLLSLLNQGYAKVPVVGGLSSGLVRGVPSWMYMNGEEYNEGAVGFALTGDIEFQTIVSQGTRPIGDPMIVTKAEGNLIYELGGKTPYSQIKKIYKALSESDKKLLQHSLLTGLVIDESKQKYERGDFVIRNIMGFDQKTGVMAIGEYPKVGQTLQFQLRDANSSEEDLTVLLTEGLKERNKEKTEGGFLVSCCGRGVGLFKEENHDSRLIQELWGDIEVGGFFANGEFGPIDDVNYVHGFTSSLTIIK